MSKVLIWRFIPLKALHASTQIPIESLIRRTNAFTRCEILKRTKSPHTQISLSKSFCNSLPLRKKKDKGRSGSDSKRDLQTSKAPDDPFDLSQLQTGIADALSRLKSDLSKLRAAGRFTLDCIENLRVTISKGSNETLRLGDVAQVVPKSGRMVTLLVNDEDVLKPVNSAIIASDLSLTPQPDSHNPLQLNIPVPPPTKESREQTSKAAKAAMDKAVAAVRSSRGVLHKRLQDMQKRKEARPDDVRKAHDQMEKLAEKGQKEIKDTFEFARKALE